MSDLQIKFALLNGYLTFNFVSSYSQTLYLCNPEAHFVLFWYHRRQVQSDTFNQIQMHFFLKERKLQKTKRRGEK